MLVACCSSTYYLALPISLNNLGREGPRLLSPRDSQFTSKTRCRDRWYYSRRCSWAQVGVRWRLSPLLCVFPRWSVVVPSWGRSGTVSHVGVDLLFWYHSRTMSVLDDCNVIHVFVWRGECKPTMYLFPYYLFTWVVVKITLLATLLSMRLCL